MHMHQSTHPLIHVRIHILISYTYSYPTHTHTPTEVVVVMIKTPVNGPMQTGNPAASALVTLMSNPLRVCSSLP